MNKKVLLTGATGFIGRQAIDPLLSLGFEVHAISSKQISSISKPNVVWHPLNLMDKQAVADLFATFSFSHLLHFAWDATPGKYWTSLDNLDWVAASLHLVRSFILHGGKRVVVSGTCAEYEWKGDFYCEKETPFIPSTLYGNSKRGLYLILKALCEQFKISFAWGYIFFLYGSHEYPKRFVPSVIQGLLGKESVPCSEGKQIRDFMHVKDVADAFSVLLDSAMTGGVNIASGVGITLKEIAQLISHKTGGSERLIFGAIPTSVHEPKCLVPNVTRLNSELHWKPKIGLKEGLEEVIHWWKKNL